MKYKDTRVKAKSSKIIGVYVMWIRTEMLLTITLGCLGYGE